VVRIRKAPQPDLVDLHVHSRASDGSLSPRDLVRHAREVGLKAIALTDHDTVAGVAEAAAAGREIGLEVIAGVEVSAEMDGGACHILGYFVDPEDRRLGRVLEEIRLGRGKPAYVSRPHLAPAEAIRVIHAAGGLAVLAHPRQLNLSAAGTEKYIEGLAAAGLDGVETVSPDHTANLARRYRAAARRLGLVETGGSDWHGYPAGPIGAKGRHARVHLGVGRGSMGVHYDVVEAMKARLAARRK